MAVEVVLTRVAFSRPSGDVCSYFGGTPGEAECLHDVKAARVNDFEPEDGARSQDRWRRNDRDGADLPPGAS